MPLRNLAPYYDLLFKGVSGDKDFYLKHAKKAKKVLYVACGTGRVLLPLIEKGVDVIGLDSSPHMLVQLRKKAKKMKLKTKTYKMDMRDFKLKEKFDLVIVPYHSFLNMKTKTDQKKALKNMHKHLKKGGKLILNFFNPDAKLLSMRGQRHVSLYRDKESGKSFEITEINSVDHTNKVVRTIYMVTERKDWKKPKRKMYVKLRYVFRKEFENLIKRTGFKKFRLYGGFHNQPYNERSSEMVWIVEK